MCINLDNYLLLYKELKIIYYNLFNPSKINTKFLIMLQIILNKISYIYTYIIPLLNKLFVIVY